MEGLRSTAHPRIGLRLGLAEYVGAEFVAGYPGHRLDGDATFRRNLTPTFPLCDCHWNYANGSRQVSGGASGLDCSFDHVHKRDHKPYVCKKQTSHLWTATPLMQTICLHG
jgi:hypothetical protein